MPMIDIVYQSESVYSGFISLVKVKKKTWFSSFQCSLQVQNMKETIVEFHLFIRAQSSSQMKLVDAASKAARRPSLDGVAVTGPVVGEPIPDHDPAIVGRRLHLGKQRVA